MTGRDADLEGANRQCPYEGCENTATVMYWSPDTEAFAACDDCAPPYPPIRELEVGEQ